MTDNQLAATEPTRPRGLRETSLERQKRVRQEIEAALLDDGFTSVDAFAILDALEHGYIPHVSIDWDDDPTERGSLNGHISEAIREAQRPE